MYDDESHEMIERRTNMFNISAWFADDEDVRGNSEDAQWRLSRWTILNFHSQKWGKSFKNELQQNNCHQI